MRSVPVLHDPVFVKKESYNAFERFCLKFINDERDLPFIYLSLRIIFIFIPSAILLYSGLLTGWMFWAFSLIYIVVGAKFFIGPFTLMLHNTSHRRFFKRKYEVGNLFLPWVIGPFFGQSPETYFSHHIGMHHSENNLEDDKSSTMYYQRDSLRGFLKYYGEFITRGLIELTNYFRSKNKTKFMVKCIRGELTFVIFATLMCFVSWKATLVVFILPFFLSRFGMMAGNWGQHAFISPGNPANNYQNSITCVNHIYNKMCFNDGYHIGHHLKPHMHWTDMSVDFQKNQQKYADNDAIVFEDVDFFGVWLLLMRKRYDKLADHFVNIGNRYKSDDEVISMLKERTRKFSLSEIKAASLGFAQQVGKSSQPVH